MTGENNNGILARIVNLEGWVKRIDEKLDAFLEGRNCKAHELKIDSAKKKSEKAIYMAEKADKTVKTLLITVIVAMVPIIAGLVTIILQNASQAHP